MKNRLMEKITKVCPMCGITSLIDLTEEEYTKYNHYQQSKALIQDYLPELNVCEREFLKSGYCRECQEKLFGNGKSNRIIP